jgi:Tfp pilus assembly protein PilZ
MLIDREHEFTLVCAAVEDFEKALPNKGPETGLFFPLSRQVKVGDRAMIRVSIRGFADPLFLEGRIRWRRVKPGGPRLPAGIFVGLVERERSHLDAMVKFLKEGRSRAERRKHPRFPVDIRASYGTSKGFFDAEMMNVSKAGAFLRCLGPLLSVGVRFPVKVNLGDKNDPLVQLNAQVAWIDLFEDTKGMGIGFIRGQSELREIERIVKLASKDQGARRSSSST